MFNPLLTAALGLTLVLCSLVVLEEGKCKATMWLCHWLKNAIVICDTCALCGIIKSLLLK